MAFNFQALDGNSVPTNLQVDSKGNLYTTGDVTLRVGANSTGQGFVMMALDPNGIPKALAIDDAGNLKVVKN